MQDDLTTRSADSIKEASALANKVGVLTKRMLAVGSTNSLAERVNFGLARGGQCRDAVRGAARKWLSLAQLFAVLTEHGTFAEYMVERATLESVFPLTRAVHASPTSLASSCGALAFAWPGVICAHAFAAHSLPVPSAA
ncbi:hypothetical protein B0H21DRAFT_712895, partial [Amylocystis lapponica]